MRTVCAWCPPEDVSADEARNLTYGICAVHKAEILAEVRVAAFRQRVAAEGILPPRTT